jgi:hypothetical protein
VGWECDNVRQGAISASAAWHRSPAGRSTSPGRSERSTGSALRPDEHSGQRCVRA